jgi:hypothetical protein
MYLSRIAISFRRYSVRLMSFSTLRMGGATLVQAFAR